MSRNSEHRKGKHVHKGASPWLILPIVLIAGLLLSACEVVTGVPQGTPTPNHQATAVAQMQATRAAELRQRLEANDYTATPMPSLTPTSILEPTQTSLPMRHLEVATNSDQLGGIKVLPSSDDNLYNHGATVVLTASCSFAFTGWAGDLSDGVPSTTNPLTVTMDRDRVLVASCADLTSKPTSIATPLPPPTVSISQMVEQVRGAVVRIETSTGTGSGTIFDPDGYGLTNWHVIDGNGVVDVVVQDRYTVTGNLIGYNEYLDLAVIKIGGGPWPFLPITPYLPRVGDEVFILGYPLATQLKGESSLTSGLVSNIWQGDQLTLIQTDAAMNPGNSGGAALNSSGEFIGVPTSRIDESLGGRGVDNVGFFIALSSVSDEIPSLMGGAKVASSTVAPSAGETVGNPTFGYSITVPQGWELTSYDDELWVVRSQVLDMGFMIYGYRNINSSLYEFHNWAAVPTIDQVISNYNSTYNKSDMIVEDTRSTSRMGKAVMWNGMTSSCLFGGVESVLSGTNGFVALTLVDKCSNSTEPDVGEIDKYNALTDSFFSSLP